MKRFITLIGLVVMFQITQIETVTLAGQLGLPDTRDLWLSCQKHLRNEGSPKRHAYPGDYENIYYLTAKWKFYWYSARDQTIHLIVDFRQNGDAYFFVSEENIKFIDDEPAGPNRSDIAVYYTLDRATLQLSGENPKGEDGSDYDITVHGSCRVISPIAYRKNVF